MEESVAQLKNLRKTRNPFRSYAELPQGVSYQDQEAGESVAILLRRHPITNFRWILLATIGAGLPLIVAHFLTAGPQLDNVSQIPTHIWQLLGLFWYTLLIGFILQNLLIWYYNVYLITNMRVVDVDFHGLMRYASDEAALHQIQDVSHSQGGLWQLLFHYGTVHIQTSGTRQNLDFERVPLPARVADVVTDLLPIPEDVRRGKVTTDTTFPTQSSSRDKRS